MVKHSGDKMKKRGKKKSASKIVKVKSSENIKKEFDEFAQKIAVLETMRHELDALDTRGFEQEAKLIRARLKDVTAIPQLRRELNDLKERIRHRTSRSVFRSPATSKLLKESKTIKQDTQLMKRKIAQLQDEIKKKKKVSTKKQLNPNEVGAVKGILTASPSLRTPTLASAFRVVLSPKVGV
jgi:hypothetical protein